MALWMLPIRLRLMKTDIRGRLMRVRMYGYMPRVNAMAYCVEEWWVLIELPSV